MRLLNVQTLQLELFADPVQVPYAILSHTWGDSEISFQDISQLTDNLPLRETAAFAKIQNACNMTISHGLEYIWIDTCCIDKSSSAELSEAINSMFQWYKSAIVCFVFLFDLPAVGEGEDESIALHRNFEHCRWWERGWTLQELIAPANVLFFDVAWTLRGSKLELGQQIREITGIDILILDEPDLLYTVPTAKRMSWAANRKTTRVEDIAYCLLGIFDVNMPMIYGEGQKAFVRLQEEILKRTTDLSIFAWQARQEVAEKVPKYRGLLATSPDEFSICRNIIANEDQFRFDDEIILSNKGVKITTGLSYVGQGRFSMDLDCYLVDLEGRQTRAAIYLVKVFHSYVRKSPSLLCNFESSRSTKQPAAPIFLHTTVDQGRLASLVSDEEGHRIQFLFPLETSQFCFDDIRAVPSAYWDENERFFSTFNLGSLVGFVRFTVISRQPPQPGRFMSDDTVERTNLILAFQADDHEGAHAWKMTLYAETGLASSYKPPEFIDPFTGIDKYGPLGDAFSLATLSPAVNCENHELRILHRDSRRNFVVSATCDVNSASPRLLRVKIHTRREGNLGPGPSPARQMAPQWQGVGPIRGLSQQRNYQVHGEATTPMMPDEPVRGLGQQQNYEVHDMATSAPPEPQDRDDYYQPYQ
ncbi:heterokaryon incompatibility protein-domain-containing protein [Apodospora peruviana]|uniref:Heterokaryon incompatibility protein-domain-containing protein n=1 Tax=Apodospora peruviana TaxID=516989 RepID=A0AAE0I6C2_9PEZI|nr:heterokaryon incompatibility protein-domain-containing protein [Apodospora peruviana]